MSDVSETWQISDLLERLHQAGWLRALDYQFALWLGKQQGDAPGQLLASFVSRQLGQGDVCLPGSDINDLLLSLPSDCHGPARALLSELDSHLVGDGSEVTPLIYEVGRYYLYRYWQYERQVARELQARAKPLAVDTASLKRLLDQLFGEVQPAVPDWQRVAAALAASRQLAIISGGPGTGKTTTVTRLLGILVSLAKQQGHTPIIHLSAPTGKAAARLSESIAAARDKLAVDEAVKLAIPSQGKTLHRLLGSIPNSRSFRHHRDNPLLVDILVVDEASMIDLPMMAKLLDALPETAQLILIGDRDQLASVEAGSVLGDICQTPKVAAYSKQTQALLQHCCGLAQAEPLDAPLADSLGFLQHSYRFSSDSGIGALARAANSGVAKQLASVWRQGYDDIEQISPRADHQPLLKTMLQGYQHYFSSLDQSPIEVLRAFGRFQVLCALRQGELGVETLNESFEQYCRQMGRISQAGRWYPGRPVMITRNDPGLGLYNGDIGITLIDPHSGGYRVWFDSGELRSVLPSRLPQHETVYAMTVHKSQGSEFEQVLMVLAQTAPVVTKELVYTAITRAKQRFALYGEVGLMGEAIGRCTERASGLGARLWKGDALD